MTHSSGPKPNSSCFASNRQIELPPPIYLTIYLSTRPFIHPLIRLCGHSPGSTSFSCTAYPPILQSGLRTRCWGFPCSDERVRRRQIKDAPNFPCSPSLFHEGEEKRKRAIQIGGGGKALCISCHVPGTRWFLPCAPSDIHPRGVV